MCGYDCTIAACRRDTGEVFRIAPLKFFGILGIDLIVYSFNYDGRFLVVYLE
jgi:hypothetical protein